MLLRSSEGKRVLTELDDETHSAHDEETYADSLADLQELLSVGCS